MGMQVVVLAGGIGSRLKPWTETVPKPLLPLLDKTLLEQVVSIVPENDIDEVVKKIKKKLRFNYEKL